MCPIQGPGGDPGCRVCKGFVRVDGRRRTVVECFGLTGPNRVSSGVGTGSGPDVGRREKGREVERGTRGP